jgi:dihydrofolate reductase/thymidylate synthase
MFTIVVAYDSQLGIGKNNSIPWKCPEDMKHFKTLTTGHIVIMGRKTYESIGKPLPNRLNIVFSNNMKPDPSIPNLVVVRSILECAKICSSKEHAGKTSFVIGGADVYRLFLESGLVGEMYSTVLEQSYDCDVFFPYDLVSNQGIYLKYTDTALTGDIKGYISHVKFRNWQEQEFLRLGSKILEMGNEKTDRTGTGTISLFGEHLKFDLTDNTFPLITTRKMFFRGIFEELMLYVRGLTDNNLLEEKKISVWTPNTSREFLDKRGLQHLPTGDMGPSYGFLFRHFGAKYVDCFTDYKGQGVDQLQRVIDTIKTNPNDRRMIISLWDPSNLDNCPLPPCLYNYQFYVSDGLGDLDPETGILGTKRYLSCMMTQRSSDFAVAGGWNIATGALLTILIASVTDLEPKELIWNLGDVHIYNNLRKNFAMQTERLPYPFPKLYVNKKDKIDDFQFQDCTLLGYKSHPSIEYQMSV